MNVVQLLKGLWKLKLLFVFVQLLSLSF
ncbi:hypothetical protein MTR67_030041 [Solanum verrucosum]|uniref:Uncharacterized protein n=1 Tax=Solanum verrucosum TaxID=315347 RepID=A0AAF0RDG7_SOLVR|nr:hypothetical protein MTR67_030041 [Solanum verrucosum]